MPASRKPRQHDFFFSPRDYLRDPAVLAMRHRLDARGAYSTMLLELWDQDDPGVVIADDAVLAALAWATPGEWVAVKELVAACFDLSSRPGFWVQKRMVTEHERQTRFYALKSRHGKSGRLKQLMGVARGQPGVSPGASPASPASPAESKEESTPPPRRLRAVKPRSARIPVDGSPSLPTNTGESWQPTQEEVDTWSQAYPGLDVMGTIREAHAWLIANPTRRKTFNGMARYVNGWLAREQNRL